MKSEGEKKHFNIYFHEYLQFEHPVHVDTGEDTNKCLLQHGSLLSFLRRRKGELYGDHLTLIDMALQVSFKFLFLAATAALEVQMLVCLSVCVSHLLQLY